MLVVDYRILISWDRVLKYQIFKTLPYPLPFREGDLYSPSLMVVFSIPKKADKRVKKSMNKAKSLRKRQTKAEVLLWRKLRAKRLNGYKFRRQYAIDNFIVDFCCPSNNLIIEVDGSAHKLKWKQDYIRDQKLKYLGYKVMRFSNSEVKNNINSVLNKILYHLLNNKELKI